jgi:hypothetical protein
VQLERECGLPRERWHEAVTVAFSFVPDVTTTEQSERETP